MEELTKTEEKIMQILWDIKKGFVKDVIAQMPEPKPPYNTISSVIRILEGKGFVGHKAYGKTHEYYPVITKMAYSKFTLKNMIKNYFEGSYEKLVSFMVNEKDLSNKEIKEIKDIIDKNFPKE
ncbi:BlaI/MecI/CopY family transcriptional regulator [Chondrinema litorale]|uniref:BlaI/MecI/CopY family transcriptional regulator n=1 Tax=Chondrinema litorale TaxID=2994555 RepID=UPI0025428320|nr:BlaI/MecI/CopY family transcriptional regulator [Chondrinema litorale]UZR98775.1 BlaI/MecI/CopY family transcriptional regulator [Chondrinema litorale]